MLCLQGASWSHLLHPEACRGMKEHGQGPQKQGGMADDVWPPWDPGFPPHRHLVVHNRGTMAAMRSSCHLRIRGDLAASAQAATHVGFWLVLERVRRNLTIDRVARGL